MTTSDPVERFMEAEQEANRLVEELARLKTESESYHAASGRLEQTAAGIVELAGRLSGAASRLDGVINSLREIGTPELLRTQQEARAEIEAARKQIEDLSGEIGEGIDKAVGAVKTLRAVVIFLGGAQITALLALGVLILSRL